MKHFVALLFAAVLPAAPNWITSWTGSVHGPYPAGNASAQPNLSRVFPSPSAHDQSFRMIVRPALWGRQARVRLSNAFGTQPVTFDGVFVGLQMSGSALNHDTSRPVAFGGKRGATIAPGESARRERTSPLPSPRCRHRPPRPRLPALFAAGGASASTSARRSRQKPGPSTTCAGSFPPAAVCAAPT